MKTIRVDQNSEEWLEFRRGKITGSKLKDLFPKVSPTKDVVVDFLTETKVEFNPKSRIGDLLDELSSEQVAALKARQPKKDEFYRLVADLVARPVNFNDYEAPEGVRVGWRERGHILEPEALARFAELTGKKVKEESVVWVDDNNPDIMISPDGVISATEAVEVKCPGNHVVIRAWDENRYPAEYHEQALQYFIVNEKLQTLHFVIFTDCLPSLPIQIFQIKRKDVEAELDVYRYFQEITLIEVKKLAEKLAF